MTVLNSLDAEGLSRVLYTPSRAVKQCLAGEGSGHSLGKAQAAARERHDVLLWSVHLR